MIARMTAPRRVRASIAIACLVPALVLAGCAATPVNTPAPSLPEPTTEPTAANTEPVVAEPIQFTADVWADNWFSLTVNGVLVGEDSVPISTERSFNAETISFVASYPLTIALMSKDYVETPSGLEYTGTDRQQIGDGGIIAQIKETVTGQTVAATSTQWRGLVIQRAPLNPECVASPQPDVDCAFEASEAPALWMRSGFDDSGWLTATEYSAAEVGTKEGYDLVAWDATARLIWASSLTQDNTILWRFEVG